MTIPKTGAAMRRRKNTALKLTCTRCGKGLKEAKVVWLELSNTDGNYYKDGLPEGHESQGGFAFGSACAKSQLREQAHKDFHKNRPNPNVFTKERQAAFVAAVGLANFKPFAAALKNAKRHEDEEAEKKKQCAALEPTTEKKG